MKRQVALLGVTLALVVGAQGAKTPLCNKYPPLVGFEIDRVTSNLILP